MIARICTENKNKEKTAKLVSEVFNGFAMIEGAGFWKGIPEQSLTIEIAQSNQLRSEFIANVASLARLIKHINQQESVLIECIESENIFV